MYVLLHKVIEDKQYEEQVLNYKKSGGTVYLDNSCFELGSAMDDELLYDYCKKLTPNIVILPDVLGDKKATIDRTYSFLDKYPEVACYGMAVAQGETAEDLIDCYAQFRDYRGIDEYDIAMIGIPFVYKWVMRNETQQAGARIDLLETMVNNRVIDRNRHHHLLGTWQPREFRHYQDYGWIHSIDTSNPVMAAIGGIKYIEGLGILNKPKATFDSSYHLQESDIDMNLLYNNVKMFRSIVNGD